MAKGFECDTFEDGTWTGCSDCQHYFECNEALEKWLYEEDFCDRSN